MASYHEADVDVFRMATTNHLHRPGKEIPVLIGTRSIIQVDGQTLNPRMSSTEIIPVGGQEGERVIGVLGANPLIKQVNCGFSL